jgi:diguanylate cyclase (GGDEF)-like protein
MQRRRRSDFGVNEDRSPGDVLAERRAAVTRPVGLRFPSFEEQTVQFLTRYLFAMLGLLFFNFAGLALRNLTMAQVNWLFGVYVAFNSINFAHAWYKPVSPQRYRIAMWQDIVMVSVCATFDPYDIPPSLMAYIAVVLGNGMRYGMRFFAEAVTGTLIAGVIAAVIRYGHLANELTPGAIFLSLFGVIIVIYAYVLMGRVERARHRSEQVSRTDPLTGLLNRRGLSDSATEWLAQARGHHRKLVVMLADIDNFKTVNDRYGHAEGDRVLVKVADLLLSSTRDHDMVARYGGDEFVLLLTDTEDEAAQEIAIRVQTVIDDWMSEQKLSCGISIGVSETAAHDMDLAEVLKSVDRLLYQAKTKRTGRFRVIESA